jgi:hypothetical protein
MHTHRMTSTRETARQGVCPALSLRGMHRYPMLLSHSGDNRSQRLVVPPADLREEMVHRLYVETVRYMQPQRGFHRVIQ